MHPFEKDIQNLQSSIQNTIFGKTEVVDLLLTCLFAQGHTLIEDVPGVGKTTLGSALARSIDGSFQRIQFTSDLLPSDMIGVPIYNDVKKQFEFHPGPIFANIILADEINRTTPKTQSALLEAMADGQVTVDRTSHILPSPFMVIATQNPVEFRGTYALPESQLDRFMMRISMGYPEPREELRILKARALTKEISSSAVLGIPKVIEMQEFVRGIRVDDAVAAYMLDIIGATRKSRQIDLGVSPRGSVALYRACQAHAFVKGRNFVIPDDVKRLAVSVLSHRILLSRQRDRSAGPGFLNGEDMVSDLLQKLEVPV